MLTDNLKDCVHSLIMSFDDDEGLTENIYYAVHSIIAELSNDSVASKFASLIDATDGYFYANDPTALKAFADTYF